MLIITNTNIFLTKFINNELMCTQTVFIIFLFNKKQIKTLKKKMTHNCKIVKYVLYTK